MSWAPLSKYSDNMIESHSFWGWWWWADQSARVAGYLINHTAGRVDAIFLHSPGIITHTHPHSLYIRPGMMTTRREKRGKEKKRKKPQGRRVDRTRGLDHGAGDENLARRKSAYAVGVCVCVMDINIKSTRNCCTARPSVDQHLAGLRRYFKAAPRARNQCQKRRTTGEEDRVATSGRRSSFSLGAAAATTGDEGDERYSNKKKNDDYKSEGRQIASSVSNSIDDYNRAPCIIDV